MRGRSRSQWSMSSSLILCCSVVAALCPQSAWRLLIWLHTDVDLYFSRSVEQNSWLPCKLWILMFNLASVCAVLGLVFDDETDVRCGYYSAKWRKCGPLFSVAYLHIYLHFIFLLRDIPYLSIVHLHCWRSEARDNNNNIMYIFLSHQRRQPDVSPILCSLLAGQIPPMNDLSTV